MNGLIILKPAFRVEMGLLSYLKKESKMTVRVCRYFETDDVDFSIGGEGPLANGVDPIAPVNYTSFSSVVGEVSLAR